MKYYIEPLQLKWVGLFSNGERKEVDRRAATEFAQDTRVIALLEDTLRTGKVMGACAMCAKGLVIVTFVDTLKSVPDSVSFPTLPKEGGEGETLRP